MQIHKIGHLDAAPSRADGKLIDEWSFKAAKPAGRAEDTIKIAVKVSLLSLEGKLCFRAKIPNLGTIENSDIEVLREKVEEALLLHSAARLGNVWEDWLRVTVAIDDWRERGSAMSSSLSIVVEPVKRGVDPVTKKAYLLSGQGLWAVPLDDADSTQGMLGKAMGVSAATSGFHAKEKSTISYVPATTENIAALHDVSARMVQLRARLAKAFVQDNILETLGSLSSVLVLGAPDDAGDQPGATVPTGAC